MELMYPIGNHKFDNLVVLLKKIVQVKVKIICFSGTQCIHQENQHDLHDKRLKNNVRVMLHLCLTVYMSSLLKYCRILQFF